MSSACVKCQNNCNKQCAINLSCSYLIADCNCVQILAPEFGGGVRGNVYVAGQHFGHIARECSEVLAPLFDDGFVGDSCHCDDFHYNSGFTFECHLLSNDTNKSKKGYPVSIIVLSNNSASWVHCLATMFSEKGFPPTVLV